MTIDPERLADPAGQAESQIARQRAMLAAHAAANSGEALRRKIRRQVEAWRHNRDRFPGWLVAPTDNRRTLWAFTAHWVAPIVAEAAKVEPVERLRWLRELTWRYDLCLLPLLPDHARAIADTLAAIEPFRPATAEPADTPDASDAQPSTTEPSPAPLRPTGETLVDFDWPALAQDWFALGCALLRFHREQRDVANFEALARRLETLPPLDKERLSHVTHQRCLLALERLEHDAARRLLADWRDPGPDPFWMIRKAGLLAELGDSECEELARRGLDAIRDLLPNAARGDDLYAPSREGWAMRAVDALTRRAGSRGLDFRPRLEELGALRCDPASTLSPLLTTLGTPPSGVAEARSYGLTDTLPPTLQGYQARRLLEEAGYPLRLFNVVAGGVLMRDAANWIGVASDRDGLGPSLRLGDATFVGAYLSADRVSRLAQADADVLADVARAAMLEAAPALSRAAPRRAVGGGPRRIDGDEKRRDATQRQAEMALVALLALAPRKTDAGLDATCDLIIGIRERWADGQWQVWQSLGRTLSASLEEMAPAQAGRYLLAVASLPLLDLDVRLPPVIRWDEDPVLALWDAEPRRDGGDGRWRSQVERLTRAIDPSVPRIARAQAMLRLMVLSHARGLLAEESERLARLIWSAPGNDVAATAVREDAPPVVPPDFPLPARYLLELPERRPGDAAAAMKAAVLRRRLPSFREAQVGGGPAGWNFGPSRATDPLTDALAATPRPWRTEDDRGRSIAWTVADASALLDRIEPWWDAEGADLWCAIQEDNSPLAAAMPRWRFSSIVEAVAHIVLPACGPDRPHLERAAALIRRMAAVGVHVELALPVLVAEDPSKVGEVARALRLALASSVPEKVGEALPGVFVWLDAAERGLLERPPPDLLQEVTSIVRSRRGPALSVAIQLAAVTLQRPQREGFDVILRDVGIGLQYLAVETRYGLGEPGRASGAHADPALRRCAAELLAAYAPHVAADDESLLPWFAQADEEPIRAVRAILVAARDGCMARG